MSKLRGRFNRTVLNEADGGGREERITILYHTSPLLSLVNRVTW